MFLSLGFFCGWGWLGLLTVWQGLGFFSVQMSFLVGYMLGLVTVFQGRGFLEFRVVSRLRLARFYYGFVELMVFQCLEVFFHQGICQGQLRLCKVQVFFRVQSGFALRVGQVFLRFGRVRFFSFQRYFAVRVYLRVSYDCVGFRFLRVQSCFALRAFSVFYSFLGFRVFQGLEFFAVRVLLRASYGCVRLRFFSVLSCFVLRVVQGRLGLGFSGNNNL